MPEYLSPGVYVEEKDAGPKPIEGVSTSTAGAVGVTLRGPSTGKPELVTSFADFVRRFGGFMPEPAAALANQWALNPTEGGRWWQFPLAVRGFFDNGGQRLYVKRVFSSTATASSAFSGQGLVSELVSDAAPADASVRVRHLIGVENGSSVNVFTGGTPPRALPANPFTVLGYDPVTGTLRLDNPVGQELLAGRDFVAIQPVVAPVAGPPDSRTLELRAKAVGGWGNDLSVRVRPMVGATLNILPDPVLGGLPATTRVAVEAIAGNGTITLDSVAGINNNDRVLINGAEYDVANVTPGPPATLDVNPTVPAGVVWPIGTSVRRLRPASNTGAPGPTIRVRGAAQLYTGALVELDNGADKERFTVVSVATDVVTLSGNVTQAYYEGHKLRVVEAEVAARLVRNGETETEELFQNLRLVDQPSGSLNYLVTQVNSRSQLVDVEIEAGFSASDVADFPTPANGGWMNLLGGNDGLAGLSVDDFVGSDGGGGNRTGIQALEDIDEISICLAPGVWAQTVRHALVTHCEILLDRFAVLDPPDGLSIEGIRDFRAPIDSRYAALYYPWIEVRDPSLGRNVEIAPSGHIAGIYARVDVERGVHKAPANEVIRSITGIAQDVNKREQDLLNPQGINALRFFPGRGNRVWGARTVSSDASWRYVNVRRLFLFVEESIDEGTQWVVFEPNDEPLWARIRQSVSNFLTSVWRSGALQGATAEEAFFVRCDRSTMTQDDIDNGRLICEVGIAPVKPAEFVIFRIQQKTLESQTN